MRPTRLARSIHAVIAAALAAAAPVAFAAASPADAADDPRADATTLDAAPGQAAPMIQPAITVITREEIDRSGDFSVADLLRDSVLAPSGSFRPQSGSSAQSFAGIALRGFGSGGTLVLIDGRRIAPYALWPQGGVDLNAIPLATVERIEIVPEGASARYGADAEHGVVNIVTRRLQGAELRYGVGDPAVNGGALEEVSASFGADTGRTQLSGGAAKNRRGIVFTRDQHSDAVGYSPYGNSYYDWMTGQFTAVPGFDCDGDGFYVVGVECSYDFNRVAAHEASSDNTSVHLRGTHAISDDWDVFLSASTAKVESFGRYAPTPGVLIVDDGTPADINSGVACGADGCAPGTSDGLPTYYFHRFAASGPRDNFIDGQVSDYVVGFRGLLADALEIEAGLHRSDYDASELGRGYIVQTLAEAAANRGDYDPADPFAADAAVVDGFTVTTSRDARYLRDEAFASGRFDWTLPTGVSRVAFGIEAAEERYHDVYDSLSDAGAVLGTFGVPAAADRDTQSAWIEWSLPLATNLHATLAGRHDRLDTAKTESLFSPKLSLAWQPLDWLGVRGSWGESFRAPTLQQIGLAPRTTSEEVLDPDWCLDFGCAYRVETLTTGNPELDAEQSEHWSIGIEMRAASWLVASVDYWDIDVDKFICSVGAQGVVSADADPDQYGEIPDGLSLTRDAFGQVIHVITGWGNSGGLRSRGVDLRAVAEFDFGAAGRLRNRFDATKVLDAERVFPGIAFDTDGEFGQPTLRASLQNVWNAGDFEFSWTIHHIGDHESYGGFPRVDAYTTHDLSASWTAPWNATLAVGATNVSDERPELVEYDERPWNFYLYDGYGRTVWARYTQRF